MQLFLALIVCVCTGIQAASDNFQLTIAWNHKQQKCEQQLLNITSATTIAQLKEKINQELVDFKVPVHAQKLSKRAYTPICWPLPCKKMYVTALPNNQQTCGHYGITQDTIINLEVDFVTLATLRECKLINTKKQASTTSATSPVLAIPAQQLSMEVPEGDNFSSPSSVARNSLTRPHPSAPDQ